MWRDVLPGPQRAIPADEVGLVQQIVELVGRGLVAEKLRRFARVPGLIGGDIAVALTGQ